MKIAIFGASGRTGKHVVLQALEKGYLVNAFVRDPSKLQLTDPNLEFFVGDVLKSNTYGHTLDGVDAVIITLDGIMQEGIKNILANMREKHVRRVILMSSYPMSGSPEGINYLKSAGMGQSKIDSLIPVFNDKKTQEELVIESGLNWLVVRPTFLKEEAKTGIYQTEPNIQLTATINGINRSDVAEFMVNALATNEWDNKVVSISS